MIDPATGAPPFFRKSAFGFYTIGMNAVTDGSSNTVFLAEVLQGETYDIRGLMWSTIPGGGSFFSRMPPNSPLDYYQTGIVGDYLNNAYFCVSEPGQNLPCTGNASDQGRMRGAEPPSGRDQRPAGRWLGSVPQEHRQHAGVAGPQHDQRRRDRQRRCLAIGPRGTSNPSVPGPGVRVGVPRHDRGGDRVEGNYVLRSPPADGFAGHAEDDGGGFILGDRQCACLAHLEEPTRPVVSHPRHDDSSGVRSRGLSRRAEQDFDAGPVAADGGALHQLDPVAAPRSPDQTVRVSRDHQRPAPANRVMVSGLGHLDLDTRVIVEPLRRRRT